MDDEATFDQPRGDTVGRAPAATPGWTEFNSDDPGITLLQLAAALVAGILVFTAVHRWITRRRPVD